MSVNEVQVKADLVAVLDEDRRATLAVLDKVSPDKMIYADGGWRVKDIITHITFWEEQTVLSLEAYQRGEEYVIPNLPPSEHVTNKQVYEARREYPVERVFAEFASARDCFKIAIQALSPEKLAGEIMCPWNQRHPIADLAKGMAEHETGHRQDIEKAV